MLFVPLHRATPTKKRKLKYINAFNGVSALDFSV
jgi:hypothetical protein